MIRLNVCILLRRVFGCLRNWLGVTLRLELWICDNYTNSRRGRQHRLRSSRSVNPLRIWIARESRNRCFRSNVIEDPRMPSQCSDTSISCTIRDRILKIPQIRTPLLFFFFDLEFRQDCKGWLSWGIRWWLTLRDSWLNKSWRQIEFSWIFLHRSSRSLCFNRYNNRRS